MNHYCTYFDRRFMIQGMALAASVRRHDPQAILWVLALDDFTSAYLRDLSDDHLRCVTLAELEAADPELAQVKSKRSAVEYYFTLSPCWPLHLLRANPAISRITYLDADLFFFRSPEPIFKEMSNASVLVVEHRHPTHLSHHSRCGRFNVGILSFRNNETGLGCLAWWRRRCLEWCHDRLEDGKYADQKYLDEWPERFGSELCILRRHGVNLAPWNWSQYHYTFRRGQVWVQNDPLEVFHFARFRPVHGTWWFQSGQLEYGVMPWKLRQAIYGRYWDALMEARAEIRKRHPSFDFPHTSVRDWHGFWQALGPRLLFGSDWVRVGPLFLSGRLGLGQFSGRALAWVRTHIRHRLRRWLVRPGLAPTAAFATTPPQAHD